MRFLKDSDYDMQIRAEIRRILDGSAPGDAQPSPKLLRAEMTAKRQITHYLKDRVDCDALISAQDEDRDDFIVTTMIDLVLYHLYSQSSNKDISQTRQDRYSDALEWLKLAGKGEIGTDLPQYESDDPNEQPSTDVRIFSDFKPDNNRY